MGIIVGEYTFVFKWGTLGYLMSVLESLATIHETIENESKYGHVPNQVCAHIALEVARELLDSGVAPRIMKVEGRDENNRQREIRPLLYGGDEVWYCHYVCCDEKFAYDPIVGCPVELSDYTEKVFGEELDMKSFIDSISQLKLDIHRWLG